MAKDFLHWAHTQEPYGEKSGVSVTRMGRFSVKANEGCEKGG